jgi:two-component system, NarL family, response regulator NreC
MPIRVLIADDHAVFRSGLKALLEKERDIAVAGETGTGLETIKAASLAPPDVLLLDISLPDIPGPRVAEEILKAHPHLGIVVLTMHEDEYYLQEMLRIGVRAYVLKKSSGTDLVQAIRVAQRGESYLDPALASGVISSYVGGNGWNKKTGRLEVLTRREKEVCGLLAFGHTNCEIAEKLCISERTVETHRVNILSKLELKSRAQLVRFAIDNELVRFT